MQVLTGPVERALLFPGSLTQGQREATVELPADNKMYYPTTLSDDRVALAVRQGSDATSAAVLYCYGNGMNLASAVGQLDWLSDNGKRTVAIPEYVGYGLSSGQPSERGCVEAALAALAVLRDAFGITTERMIFAGWSLGAAVALDMATRHPPAGLVLMSAFTSIADMATTMAPWGLRSVARLMSGLATSRFNNREKIARAACPVMIAHGRMDELVPFEMAHELAAAIPAKRLTFFSVALAGHNDLFPTGGLALKQAFDRFCDVCLRNLGERI
jgi:pimeloyl-ACP methyl ester carboxylesterase